MNGSGKLFFLMMEREQALDVMRSGFDVRLLDEADQPIFRRICNHVAKHGKSPSVKRVQKFYPDLPYVPNDDPLSMIIEELIEERCEENIREFFTSTQHLLGESFMPIVMGAPDGDPLFDDMGSIPEDINKLSLEQVEHLKSAMRETIMRLNRLHLDASDVTMAFGSGEDVLREYINRKEGLSKGLPLPFKEIERDMRGLPKGHLTGIQSRPGKKKTFILCLCAGTAAIEGHRALLASTEMTPLELKWRVSALMCRLPYTAFSEGKMTKADEQRLKDWLHSKESLPLRENLIIGSPRNITSIPELEIEAAAHGVEGVYVDNVQAFVGSADGTNNNEKFMNLLQDFKSFVIRRNVAALFTTHKNRYGGRGMSGTAYSDAFNAWSSYMFEIGGKSEQTIDISNFKAREGMTNMTYRYNADLNACDWSYVIALNKAEEQDRQNQMAALNFL